MAKTQVEAGGACGAGGGVRTPPVVEMSPETFPLFSKLSIKVDVVNNLIKIFEIDKKNKYYFSKYAWLFTTDTFIWFSRPLASIRFFNWVLR